MTEKEIKQALMIETDELVREELLDKLDEIVKSRDLSFEFDQKTETDLAWEDGELDGGLL